MPSIFVSHGAPTLAIEDCPARRFLSGYGGHLGRPAAVVVLSAHWLTRTPLASAAGRPETVHDFGGFPEPLYALRYPAPGDPALAGRVAALLGAAGFEAAIDTDRGLDHGAWVPLMLMYPRADVPVLQVSLQPHLGPRHSLRVGEALAELGDAGVLVMGSGSATHNLRAFAGRALDATPPPWVTRFSEWLHARLRAGERDLLLEYRARAPDAALNHPSEEHLLPLFAAMGAAASGAAARRVHTSHTHGVLAMDVYEFG